MGYAGIHRNSYPRNALGMSDKGEKDLRKRGPADRRQVPTRLCGRLDVVDLGGPMSYFAADVQIYQKNGEEQSGR